MIGLKGAVPPSCVLVKVRSGLLSRKSLLGPQQARSTTSSQNAEKGSSRQSVCPCLLGEG